MEIARIKSIIESLVFASDQPLSSTAIRAAFAQVEGVESLSDDMQSAIRDALKALETDYQDPSRALARGFRLEAVAGGWQFRTVPGNAEYIRRMLGQRPPRMSRAAAESLAVVAYKQPVTRSEVEEVRGVDSGPVLRALLDKRMIKVLGKKDEPGRPLIYGTTREFLAFFGLRALRELPTLKDFEEVAKDAGASPEAASAATRILGIETDPEKQPDGIVEPATKPEGAGEGEGEALPEETDADLFDERGLLDELAEAMARLDSSSKAAKEALQPPKPEPEPEAAPESEPAPPAEPEPVATPESDNGG